MIRPATHAGSWYEGDGLKLRQSIEAWLEGASHDAHSFRFAIGPHAGYRFCGPVLAQTYAQIDSSVDRIVLMGPSHFKYFKGVKTTAFSGFATPLGNLRVDMNSVTSITERCKVTPLDESADLKEHSWEMHLPMIALLAPQAEILPLLFGAVDKQQTESIIAELVSLNKKHKVAFVVSSDFCHWGQYFDYTPFSDAAPLIYKQIEKLDHQAIALLESGCSPETWNAYIQKTGNTICGATPIGVMLMLILRLSVAVKFRNFGYAQSSQVRSIKDSSVSYAALAG